MIATKRKGISTFIATLLLMVLAISAGVVIYAYTMGYLGSFGGPQTMGAIGIDTWSLDLKAPADATLLNPGNGLSVYVRNIGKATFQLDKIYVNGLEVGTPATTYTLNENDVKVLQIKQAPRETAATPPVLSGFYPWVGSTTYDVKIIGKDKTQLSFQVKK